MKLFISWSGERSHALATALREWFPLVLHYVRPWLSEADISAGERWAEAVAKELEACNFGIICVTRQNIASQWVLFEAGALAKSLQGSGVIPLLLDLDFREITGPLAQFQAKKIDKNGLYEVAHSLNNVADQPVPEARFKQLFDALWPQCEKIVEEIPRETQPARHTRPQHDILEELVTGVRALEARFRDIGTDSLLRKRREPKLFSPRDAVEMAEMARMGPTDLTPLLILLSPLREDAQWLYEPGYEIYSALKRGKTDEAEKAYRDLIHAVRMSEKRPGPFQAVTGVDQRLFYHIQEEINRVLQRRGRLQNVDSDEPRENNTVGWRRAVARWYGAWSRFGARTAGRRKNTK
jgi:hypothetical protein